jgi:hypothetical protein
MLTARDSKLHSDTKHEPETIPSALSRRLDQHFFAYALAGAGAVTLAPPANAEIVYTPADVTFTSGVQSIDLDHDGTNDFALLLDTYAGFYDAFGILSVSGHGNNGAGVLGRKVPRRAMAYAVAYAFPIGPDSPRRFVNVRTQRLEMARAGCYYNYGCHSGGQWANVVKRFLGFRFEINGEVHYGWARLSVRARTSDFPCVKAHFTGYAYETTPNKTILAGDTGLGADASIGSGDAEEANVEVNRTQEPPSLTLLSLGSLGLDAWRRKQDLKPASPSQEH